MPPMNPSPMSKLKSLHSSIIRERESLVARLREVDAALASMGVTTTQRIYGMHTPTGRTRNKLSLRKTVIQILQGKAMTKEEILDAVIRAGYVFATDDPMNSLGVILYGRNPKFKKTGGKFSV
jgi:hypothetical protein